MPLQIHGSVQTVDVLIAANAVGINIKKGEPKEAIWFAQGILSPGAYINNRKLKSHPKEWDAILTDLRCLVGRLQRQYESDRVVIASVASGGDAHAAVVAWRQGLPHVSVRKAEKGHGGQKGLIDGDPEVLEGAKVFLIEDMSSTLTSSLNAMKPLEEAGAQVVEIILISAWGFPEFMRNVEGHSVHVLCMGSMIIDRSVERNTFDTRYEPVLRHWIEDPYDDSWADSTWKVPAKKS